MKITDLSPDIMEMVTARRHTSRSLKHRTVKQLKAFLKTNKKHFKVNVTGLQKQQLIVAIERGMRKEHGPALKQAYAELAINPKSKPVRSKVYGPFKPLPPPAAKKQQSYYPDYYTSQPRPLVYHQMPPQRRNPWELPFLDADVKQELKQQPRSILQHHTPKSNIRL